MRQSLSQRGGLTRPWTAAWWCHDIAYTMPGGLFQTALGMAYPAQLARQAKLAKAGPGTTLQGYPPAGGGNCQGYRQIDARLVHTHTSDYVDEDIGAACPDPPVAPKDGQHQGEAVAIEPRYHTPRLLELGGSHQRLHLDEQWP